ncbi:glycosyltransferase [Micromonospora sp. HUAS LYJ1]|uniref:glycosyltransferase n=1 Tax=Micromonospora sp. HUAS LYJ1 TaxID=3061626 RepID=UPI0026711829|nr:glycosyltransferase [Micromonospora sp. HUAS LYJ1]WKU05082.1 glycosyltransferase [Micromonospora sp. HUAS LYJ1]
MTSGCFEPGFRGGGPVRSVATILDATSSSVLPTLVTRDRDLGAREPYPGLSGRWADRGRARIFYLDLRRPRHWVRLWRDVRPGTFDLLYLNGMWSSISVVALLAVRARLVRVPRILIAPRGECSSGALSVKARKKQFFLSVWRHVLRRVDPEWHATSAGEAADIVTLFPWARVRLNSGPSTLPAQPIAPPVTTTAGPARLVFIGRIAAIKNLLLVLTALGRVRAEVVFDIYGPVEDHGYWEQCREALRRLPSTVRATYRGELRPEAVRETFHEYDAFLFPTLGENFGHVVAESLSASCPVICSAETPWSSVLEAGGGVVLTDPSAEELGGHVERIAAMSPEQRRTARLAAAAAYRTWRAGATQPTILDEILLADAAR